MKRCEEESFKLIPQKSSDNGRNILTTFSLRSKLFRLMASVFPNPTSSSITIYSSEKMSKYKFRLYSIYGCRIDVRMESNTLDISQLNDGVYFLSSPFMRSDHGLLWYKGLPAIFFSDGASFRNPNYHKSTDTPETINQEFLKMNTKLVAVSLAS